MKIHKLPYINPLMHSHHSHFLAFDIEFDKWHPVEDLPECDIIPLLVPYGNDEIEKQCKFIIDHGYQGQPLIALDLFHADDQVNDKRRYNQFKEICKNYLTDKVAVVHTNKENNEDIFYDFLWNRQKAYFTDYNKYDLNDRTWTWGSNIKMYGLTKMFKFPDCKKFLTPNRIQLVDGNPVNHHRFSCRKNLADFLTNKDGFISDPANNVILDPEQEEIRGSLLGGRSGTWYPVSNQLYNSSFISIYIETITMTSSMTFQYKTITEKTWDPLIKGHFILPFGYAGLIEDIRSYGFWLPDWVDYSYDTVYNDYERFQQYLRSVEQVLEKDLNFFKAEFEKSLDKLYYNRMLFWNRPYDSLYDKIIRLYN